MLFSGKNVLVVLTVILLVCALTDARPVPDDNEACNWEGMVRDYVRNAYGTASERALKALNWLKRKTQEGVVAARRSLQNLEHSMSDPAENELTA